MPCGYDVSAPVDFHAVVPGKQFSSRIALPVLQARPCGVARTVWSEVDSPGSPRAWTS